MSCARTRGADMFGLIFLLGYWKSWSRRRLSGTRNVDGKAMRIDLERAVTAPAVR